MSRTVGSVGGYGRQPVLGHHHHRHASHHIISYTKTECYTQEYITDRKGKEWWRIWNNDGIL